MRNLPVAAVVYAPKLKELFTAIRGQGAHLNSKRIRVSVIREVGRAMISVGKGTERKDFVWWGRTVTALMDCVRTIKLYGAYGLEMSYVGCGRLDVHLNSGSEVYDYAPGSLIVSESQGVVLSHQGNEWSITDQQLVASNPLLANRILKMIKRRKG